MQSFLCERKVNNYILFFSIFFPINNHGKQHKMVAVIANSVINLIVCKRKVSKLIFLTFIINHSKQRKMLKIINIRWYSYQLKRTFYRMNGFDSDCQRFYRMNGVHVLTEIVSAKRAVSGDRVRC